jgi:hypothetical protein
VDGFLSTFLETIRFQRLGFEALGCPFYGGLADELLVDVEQNGPVARVLAPFADAPFEAAYVLRFLGGIHRMVLGGDAAEVARHYPSVGGDGDASAAMEAIRALVSEPPPLVLDALTRPPQTNEVGRSAALASGLMVIARETELPLQLREVATSGGLNLRPDAYWYEQVGEGWGDPSSPVRFTDLWEDGTPPFSAPCQIADRRGCDRDPIDVLTETGALTLLSYVWPEPAARFVRARDAIELFRKDPPLIDRAAVEEWLPGQLEPRTPGHTMVVYQSVFWQYIDEGTQGVVRAMLHEAGRRSTPDSPLAWLCLEPTPETYFPARLRLTLWDGRTADPPERLLATTGFHGGPLRWLA